MNDLKKAFPNWSVIAEFVKNNPCEFRFQEPTEFFTESEIRLIHQDIVRTRGEESEYHSSEIVHEEIFEVVCGVCKICEVEYIQGLTEIIVPFIHLKPLLLHTSSSSPPPNHHQALIYLVSVFVLYLQPTFLKDEEMVSVRNATELFKICFSYHNPPLLSYLSSRFSLFFIVFL